MVQPTEACHETPLVDSLGRRISSIADYALLGNLRVGKVLHAPC